VLYSHTYILSPLDQFEVRNLLNLNASVLGNINLSLTNIGLYLTIGNNNNPFVWNI